MTALPLWVERARYLRLNATPGPWTYEEDEYSEGFKVPQLISIQEGCSGTTDFRDKEDAAFIASAPTTQERMERALEIALEALCMCLGRLEAPGYAGGASFTIAEAKRAISAITALGENK